MNSKKLFILLRGILNLAMTMMMTAAIVYRIDDAKLAPYQLILLGTALEIAVIFFEIPTGVIADKYSRKLSVILGFFIIGLGFLIELSSLKFVFIFLAQIVWGFGYTFISGALDAWVSDETNNDQIEKTYIHAQTLSQWMNIVGILSALLFGLNNIRIPMFIGASIFIFMSFVLIFIMKETKKPHHMSHSMVAQFKLGVKHIIKHPFLKIFVATAFLLGLFSEGIDRLEELIILERVSYTFLSDLPSIYIVSLMHISVAILGMMMLFIIKKYVAEGIKTYYWFFALLVMMSFGLFIFAYADFAFLSIAGFLFFRMTRQGLDPLYTSVQAREIPSHIKATVMSTFGQIDGIGQIFSGILMTLLALFLGTKSILTVTALILLVAAYTIILLIKKHRSLYSEINNAHQ